MNDEKIYNPNNLTPEEYAAYKNMRKDVQLPLEDFEDIETYPPFSISSIKPTAEEFHKMYWRLWREGNDLLDKEFPSNFRPYKELYATYGDEIRTAKEYREKSNNNSLLAAEMYAKDHKMTLSDEDYFVY